MGDHGMTAHGDHGGETRDEVEAALFVYSKAGFARAPAGGPSAAWLDGLLGSADRKEDKAPRVHQTGAPALSTTPSRTTTTRRPSRGRRSNRSTLRARTRGRGCATATRQL